MRVFFDTEFFEDGRTIDLISIGMVREDGQKLYLENADFDAGRADDWLKENVIPKLRGGAFRTPHRDMGCYIVQFAGPAPEIWAYYADYDWVALCQTFGRMIDLPIGWPMYCRDLKQEADRLGVRLPKMASACEHNALYDAEWAMDAFDRFIKPRLEG